MGDCHESRGKGVFCNTTGWNHCDCKEGYCASENQERCEPKPTPTPTAAPTAAPTPAPTSPCDSNETKGTCSMGHCDESRGKGVKCEERSWARDICVCQKGYCASEDRETCVRQV